MMYRYSSSVARAVTAAMAFSCAAWSATTLHVSAQKGPAGNGTKDEPFRTLIQARNAIRQLKTTDGLPDGGITVLLHKGAHRLLEPLDLTEADSGAGTAPVIYKAVPEEDVWLSGGVPVRLERFRTPADAARLQRLPEAARQHVRVFDLANLGAELSIAPWPDAWMQFGSQKPTMLPSVCEVYCGAQRLPMARWPNQGYATFGEIVSGGPGDTEGPHVVTYKEENPSRWSLEDGVWLYGYWYRAYRAEMIRVRMIDTAKKTIELAGENTLRWLEDKGAKRYRAMHVLEELDSPGEWYLDSRRRQLYLWPPREAGAGTEVVVAVNAEALVRGREVSHVEFHGLGLEHCRGAGIDVQGGEAVRFVACEVRNVGTTGMILREGQRYEVRGCDIHHIGGTAISLKSGDRATLTSGESVIENCHIHHTGRILRPSRAIGIGKRGVGTRVAHNLIHDTGYIALGFSYSNDNLIEFNRFFRTNVETSEGGVLYCGRDWTSRGTVVRYNFVHHVEDSMEGGGSSTRFMHLDDSAPGVELYGNICYRIGGGISVCGGADNHIHDNLFVECNWGVDIGPRGKDMFASDGKGGYLPPEKRSTLEYRLRAYKYSQPPYSTRYPKLVEIFTKEPIAAPWFNVITRNVMVDCARGIRRSSMRPEWSIIEDNWEGADPGFVNPNRAALDFRLRPDAPVIRDIGFKPIPIEKIGLYESPNRRTWPVDVDLPPEDWKPRWLRIREAAMANPGALPVFRAMQVTGKLVIDGNVSAMEWTPGDATGTAPEIHDTAELIWTARGRKSTRPCQALIQTDDAHLYVRFDNPTNSAKGVSGGHRWGRDDAVEIALAEVGTKVGPTVVLRGYTDGVWESSPEAGAPATVVERVRNSNISYAAHVEGPGLWTAEWKIPFAALGTEPDVRNPRFLMNLSVRNTGDNEWTMWRSGGGGTCDVYGSGLLWLAHFGEWYEQAPYKSSASIHVIGSGKTPVLMEPLESCQVYTPEMPLGSRLSAPWKNLPDEWQTVSFSFTPKSDGAVRLVLIGGKYQDPATNAPKPLWVYCDDVQVEGAVLANGDFENVAPNGTAEAWQGHAGATGVMLEDAKRAASGKRMVKVAHDRRFSRSIQVRGGVPVTIRMKLRGSPTGL